MPKIFRSGSCAAALLIASTQPMLADVTAQDVWSDWQDYMTGYGYVMSATETANSAGVNLSDLSMSFDVPEEDVTITMAIPEMAFVNKGDGSVDVAMPSSMPMTVVVTENGREQARIVVNMEQTGHSMVVSGDPGDMNYNYVAATVGMSLGSIIADGEQAPPDLAKVSLAMGNVISSTRVQVGDMRTTTNQSSVATLSYDIAINEPGGDEGMAAKGGSQDLRLESTSVMPRELNFEDPTAFFTSGIEATGGISYGPGSVDAQFNVDGDAGTFSSTSQGGKLAFAMDKASLMYEVAQYALQVNMTTSEFPLPISLELAEAAVKLLAPIGKSEGEQDFELVLKLVDFQMADMLWGIIDQANIFPHDPATIVIDVTGKGQLEMDLFDPMAIEAMDRGAPPGKLNALDLNQLLVSAVGAKLAGSGAFTFDNSDLASFGGVPKPTGSVDLELEGANGLLDKLIMMGLVSEDDAMGARMMMSMFGVPGDGPDSLKSKLEINAEGHILANGQRLQ